MPRKFSALPSDMRATLHSSLAASARAEDELARASPNLPWPGLVAGLGVMSLGNLMGSLWLGMAGGAVLLLLGLQHQAGQQRQEQVRATFENDVVDREGVEFAEKLMKLLEVDLNPKRPMEITLASRPNVWPKVHAFSLGTRKKYFHPWFKLKARLADGPLLTISLVRHCKFKVVPKSRARCVYLERAADIVYLTCAADSALDSETVLGRLQALTPPERVKIEHWRLNLRGSCVQVKVKLTPGVNACVGFDNVQRRNFSPCTLNAGQGLLTPTDCLALLIWLFRGLG